MQFTSIFKPTTEYGECITKFSGTFQGYCVVYAEYEYESVALPPDWYMPDVLGICEVIEHGERGFLQIVVAKEAEPFRLQIEQPVLRYKDEFYQVSPLWVTPVLREPWWTWDNGSILTGIGMILTLAWITLITEWRKALKSSSNAFGIEPPHKQASKSLAHIRRQKK